MTPEFLSLDLCQRTFRINAKVRESLPSGLEFIQIEKELDFERK